MRHLVGEHDAADFPRATAGSPSTSAATAGADPTALVDATLGLADMSDDAIALMDHLGIDRPSCRATRWAA